MKDIKDVVLQKKFSIERCIQQIRDYYALPSTLPFDKDFMKQDAIILNLQRAAQLCIDLANIIVRDKKLGLPKASRDNFQLLEDAEIISSSMNQQLAGMVGFRNILVHEYTKLDLMIVIDVVEHRLDGLIDFAQCIVGQVMGHSK